MLNYKKIKLILLSAVILFWLSAIVSLSIVQYKSNRIIDKSEIYNDSILSYNIDTCYNTIYYTIYYNKYKINISIDNHQEKYKKNRISFYRNDINGDIINGVFNVKNNKDKEFLNQLINKLK